MQLSDLQSAFVNRQPVGRLATADAMGRPHVIPVCFVYQADAFYIAIDEKPKQTLQLKRLRNIAENPQVALVVDVYSQDWAQLAWVMIQGKAIVWQRGADFPHVLMALRSKYSQYEQMGLEERPLIAIMPEHVASWGNMVQPT